MADASLYNGQKNGAPTEPLSIRFTSCTLSTNENSGVSVENALDLTKYWFVLRVTYGRALKAKDYIEARGIECYVPYLYRYVVRFGKKRIVKKPLLPSMIFVYSTEKQISALLQEQNINTKNEKALLSFYYDHTMHRTDEPLKNPPMIIRNAVMANFIRLTTTQNPHIIPITSENVKYKMGDWVQVIQGEFKGISGRVARIAGQQRVVVELFEGCLVATAYIPKEAMVVKGG